MSVGAVGGWVWAAAAVAAVAATATALAAVVSSLPGILAV